MGKLIVMLSSNILWNATIVLAQYLQEHIDRVHSNHKIVALKMADVRKLAARIELPKLGLVYKGRFSVQTHLPYTVQLCCHFSWYSIQVTAHKLFPPLLGEKILFPHFMLLRSSRKSGTTRTMFPSICLDGVKSHFFHPPWPRPPPGCPHAGQESWDQPSRYQGMTCITNNMGRINFTQMQTVYTCPDITVPEPLSWPRVTGVGPPSQSD